MVKKLSLAFIIICISFVYSQDFKITDFRPPSYKIFEMPLRINVRNYYPRFSYGINLYPSYSSVSDTAELHFGGKLSINHGEWYSYSVSTYTGILHYLSLIFLRGRLNIDYNRDNFTMTPYTWNSYLAGKLEAGFGFGHIREGYFAALALHINKILKQEGVIINDLTKESLFKIAQLVTKKHASIIKYERYRKYLFAELQRAIESDPAYENTISAYALFKICEVVDDRYPNMLNYLDYWSRPFGTRFSFDFVGDRISDFAYSNDDRRSFHFPLIDSVYWVPGFRITLEYGKPLSLKRHLFNITQFTSTLYDSITSYRVSNDLTHMYGIIDRLIFVSKFHTNYFHRIAQDTTTYGFIYLYPELSLSYYLEDHISLTAEIRYSIDINIEYSDLLEISADHGIRIDCSTRWYIF